MENAIASTLASKPQDQALVRENAIRAREAGWLGIGSLLAVMMFYSGTLSLTIGYFVLNGSQQALTGTSILHDLVFDFPWVPIVLTHLLMIGPIFWVGRKWGIRFYHHRESASEVGVAVYWLCLSSSAVCVSIWGIGNGIFQTPPNYGISNSLVATMILAVANFLPTIALGFIWARVLEWSRLRWGSRLEELSPRADGSLDRTSRL